jgi:predicted site-specific integrase-resolvase
MALKLLSVKECKEIYGLSRITLINYEKKGLIKPVRTPGGVRRYRVEDLVAIVSLFAAKIYGQRGAKNAHKQKK